MSVFDRAKCAAGTVEGLGPAETYARLAEGTGFFKPVEIEVLKEVILDYQKSPGADYFFFEEADNGEMAGFIIFGRTSLTDFAWDIYWIAVGRSFQGRGIGRKLLNRAEKLILAKDDRAVLRIETSGKQQYGSTQVFYDKTGFLEAGRIPDFYAEGDDLVNYYKKISRS